MEEFKSTDTDSSAGPPLFGRIAALTAPRKACMMFCTWSTSLMAEMPTSTTVVSRVSWTRISIGELSSGTCGLSMWLMMFCAHCNMCLATVIRFMHNVEDKFSDGGPPPAPAPVCPLADRRPNALCLCRRSGVAVGTCGESKGSEPGGAGGGRSTKWTTLPFMSGRGEGELLLSTLD